jgi:replicative DNA helicase
MLDAGALAGQSSRTVREVALGVVKSIQDRSRGSGGITGIPTGLSALDDITAGLQAKDLIIVAARPSMGKTALALNMAQGACVDHGIPVLVFSLEMGAEQLVERMICSIAQADQTAVRRGRVAGDEWGEILRAADRVASAPIQIDDTPAPTIAEMRARARRWRTDRSLFPDGGPGLVVVDYLQLARGSAGQRSREQEISEISRGLKAMAKELYVPVVALSQLNRAVDSRPSHRPMMSDLRESGAIEQDADVIMFIYRAEQYMDESTPESERAEARGRAEVIVGKQRNGATGTVRATFRARSTTFVDL